MEILTNLFQQLLSMAVTALPVMAVVLLVRVLLKKAPKKYVYLLWLVMAFRLVCPVAAESPVGIVPAEEVKRQLTEIADDYVGDTWIIHDDSPHYEAAVTAGREPIDTGEGHSYVVAAADQLGEPDTVENTWLPVLSILWLVGTVVMAVYLMFSTLRLRKQVATAVRREDNVWECVGIPTPFVLGLLRPRIYIPFRMMDSERTYILAHERYHIRCGDHWAKLLGLGILTVYWWDPAVWLCWVLFCRDMEMRCDEAVLAQLGDGVKKEYSLSLVSFALDRRAPMALAFGEHEAARRVKNVLRWKRAKPAVAVLAVAAVVVVGVVCGTNAVSKSWLKAVDHGHSVEFTCDLEEPIRSWGLYQDVYEDGKLVSSEPCVMADFIETAGTPERRFTATLLVEPVAEDGGFVGELVCSFGNGATLAEWTLDLPKDRYTNFAMALAEGNDELSMERELSADSDVILYSVMLSTDASGTITGVDLKDGIIRTNDTVVQYRLMTFTGPVGALQSLDLAQTLYDLRVTSRKDYDGVRALLTAMDVDLPYSIVAYEQTVELAFEESLDDQQEAEMWSIAHLLLALIEDADQVNYSFPTADGAHRLTDYCDMEQAAVWAKNMGYENIKDLGQSAEGIRELMEYVGWGDTDDSATALLGKTRGVSTVDLMDALLGADLWDGGLSGGYQDSFGTSSPHIQFDQIPADPDALDIAMARRAVVLMRMRPQEVSCVEWSYPDEQGGTMRREFYQDEADMIISLSSHSRVHQQLETEEDLKLLIQFLSGLDETLFLRFVEEGNSMAPTLAGTVGQGFTGIMGYDGIRTQDTEEGSFWNMWTYYAEENGQRFPIAESFGFSDQPQDYSVDLDGDGVTELVANVTYGGDGHETVYVYQRRADGIYRGELSAEDLPNFNNRGVNATSVKYDPEEGVFRLRYAQKDTEEYGLLETRGLERFVFSKYGN